MEDYSSELRKTLIKAKRKINRARYRKMIMTQAAVRYGRKRAKIVPFLRQTPLDKDEAQKIATIDAVRYNNIVVSLKCLHDENELNDEVINTYLGMFESSYVFVHSSHFHSKLTQGGYNVSNASFWKHELYEYRAVLFPLHVNGNHWIIAAADTRTRTLLVYDSMESDNDTPKYEQVLTDLVRYLSEKSRLKWSRMFMECAKQTNSYDCGVYCCTFGMALLVWYNHNQYFLPRYFDITPWHINNQRKHIKLNILA